MKPAEFIRNDLYAVKIKCGDNGSVCWVVERIYRNLAKAQQYIRNRKPALGYALKAKIVHPRQWIVDAFCLYGNNIED